MLCGEDQRTMRPVEPVSRIMTEAVVVIESHRALSEVFECFRHYPIHHVPVVRSGRLVGMLSSADLAKVEHFAPRGAIDRAAFLDGKFRIEQIMQTPVVSCSPSASVDEVAELIISSGNHAITIIDADERVIGIVTTTDIMRSLLHGPPRRESAPQERTGQALPQDEASAERTYRRKPTPEQSAEALQAAETSYVAGHDPHSVAKTLLYLDERRAYLEKVLVQADRYLTAGQDEHNHALLLKAVFAAKRADEHAAAAPDAAFPLQ
jgi:CBS domain-containing membrane protein